MIMGKDPDTEKRINIKRSNRNHQAKIRKLQKQLKKEPSRSYFILDKIDLHNGS
jgi:hypothetical protein